MQQNEVITESQAVQRVLAGLSAPGEINEKFVVDDQLPEPEPIPRSTPTLPRKQQLEIQVREGTITPSELNELRGMYADEQKEAAPGLQLERLRQQKLAGLLNEAEYVEKRKALLEQTPDDDDDSPSFEGDDLETAKRKLWEQYHSGKISLERCLDLVGPIRARQDRDSGVTKVPPGRSPNYEARRQLLSEQLLADVEPCEPGCRCDECHMKGYRQMLTEQVKAGRISESKMREVISLREAML